MGQPKSRVRWRGGTLLDDAIRRARAVTPEVHVMSGAGFPFDRFRAGAHPRRWWYVPTWREGQSQALKAALRGPGRKARGVLVLLVDQPLVAESHLCALMAHAENKPSEPMATGVGGLAMAPAWLPRSVWPELRALQGDQGAGRLLRQLEVRTLECPEAARDIDTPAQLWTALAE